MRKFVNATRKQQKTIYGFIKQYSLHLQSKSDSATESEYWVYKAKEELKRLYMELTKDFRDNNPLKLMRNNIEATLSKVLDMTIEKENQIDIIMADVNVNLIEYIEDLALKLEPTVFSLALHIMSKERATLFIRFLIEYFLDNEIGLGEELHNMIIENEHDNFIFACLKNKKCAICGDRYVDLDHWDTVASEFGTYDKDDGSGTYISLCRQHHTEKHAIGQGIFLKKYKKKGIRLTEYQIKELKKIYINHFKAFNDK